MNTRPKKSRYVAALAAAVCLVGSLACGSDGAGERKVTAGGKGTDAVGTGLGTPNPSPLKEKVTVKVAYSAPIDAFMSLLLAKEFGEFEKENLNVELVTIPTTDGSVLLAQNKAQVQIAGMNASAFNVMSQPAAPIKFVTTAVQAPPPLEGTWVNNDFLTNGKLDAAKIKGQPVALGIGGGGYGNSGAAGFFLAGQEAGLAADAVKFQTLQSPVDIAQAMLSNRVAAGFVFEPGLSQLLEQKDRFTQIATTVPGVIFLANSKWIRDRPDVAAAFFRAIMRTNRTYLQGNYLKDSKVVSAIAKLEAVPEDKVKTKGLQTFSPDLDATAQKAAFATMQSMFRSAKVLSYNKDLTADDVFDETPVKDVLAGKY